MQVAFRVGCGLVVVATKVNPFSACLVGAHYERSEGPRAVFVTELNSELVRTELIRSMSIGICRQLSCDIEYSTLYPRY